MASKTVTGSNGYHDITMTVTQKSQDITNNRSTVEYSIKLSPHGTYTGYDWKFTYNEPVTVTYIINGTTRTCTLMSYGGTGTATMASGTQTVNHNSDGTKSISWSFSFTSQSGYSFLPGSGSSGNQTLTLTTIPRASTFTASNGTLGTSQTFTVTRASTSFTHTMTYKVGSTSGQIGSAKTKENLTWKPDVSLASQNKTGSTLSCTLTLTTYNGNTTIGTSSKTITLTIPSGNPSFTLGTSDTKGHLSTYSGYIKTKSVIRTSLTSVSCTYSATVKSYSVTYRKTNASGDSLATGSTATTDWTPNWAGTVHITATVTDSRGRATSKTTTVTVLDYANPTFSSYSARRYPDETDMTPSDVGGYARATYGANYSSLSNKNPLSVTVKYKIHSQPDSTYSTILNGGTSASATTNAFPADVDKVYDVKIILKDNFNTSEDIYKIVSLSTASSFMHWPVDGNGIAFGKMSEESGTFEIGYNKLKIIGKTDQPELLLEHRLMGYRADIYIMNADAPALAMGLYDESNNWYAVTRMYKEGLYPYTNKVANLGSIGYQWHNICGETIYENGTSLANKYHPKMSLTNLGTTNNKEAISGSWVTVQTNTFTSAGTYLIIGWADWTTSFSAQTNFRLRLSRSGNSSVAERTVRHWAQAGGGAVNAVFWSVSANDVLNFDVWQGSGETKKAHTSGHWLKLS